MVEATVLAATTPQTITASSAGSPAHTHTVMLTPANLTALRAGTPVTAMSSMDSGHTHSYLITCT